MASKNNNGKAAKPIEDVKNVKARKQLPDLCARVRELQDEINARDLEKKALVAEITKLAKSARLVKVRGEGWLLTKSGGSRSAIKAEKLLEKGVSLEIIEYATETSEWSSYRVLESK